MPNPGALEPLRIDDSDPDHAWKRPLIDAWRERHLNRSVGAQNPFPLAIRAFGEDELVAMVEVLLSGQLTLGENVRRAELAFAKAVGAPFAVMVNSGSSANLLAVSAAMNRFRPKRLNPGDCVLVPAVCWSTSLFPLMQLGLQPVFVDADPVTLNVSETALAEAIAVRPECKAVLAVHVLGNSCDMAVLTKYGGWIFWSLGTTAVGKELWWGRRGGRVC